MEVAQGIRGLYRLFSAAHDFPDAWQLTRVPAPDSTDAPQLSVVLGPDRFPFLYHDRALKIDKVAVFLRTADYDDGDPFSLVVHPPTGNPVTAPVAKVETQLGGLPAGVADFGPGDVAVTASAPWRVEFTNLPSALTDEVDVDGTTVFR